jgi:dCMP deaminase
MCVAYVMSERATCSRQQNGAVLAREGRVLSTGYNGVVSGLPHCVHDATERSETDDSGRDTGCPDSVHAEANALAFAAKYGVALDGAWLYVTTVPCLRCAQLVVNAGIGCVVADRSYRLDDGVKLLQAAGVTVYYLDWVEDQLVEDASRR